MINGIHKNSSYARVIRRLQRGYYFAAQEEKSNDGYHALEGIDILNKLILGVTPASKQSQPRRRTLLDSHPDKIKIIQSIMSYLKFNDFLNVLTAVERSQLHTVLMQDIILSRAQFDEHALDPMRNIGTLVTLRPVFQYIVEKLNQTYSIRDDFETRVNGRENCVFGIGIVFLMLSVMLGALVFSKSFPMVADKAIVGSMSLLMMGTGFILMTSDVCQRRTQADHDLVEDSINDLENQLNSAYDSDPAIAEYFRQLSPR